MRVKAIQAGFYLRYRDKGALFDIPDDGKLFSKTWMEALDPLPPVRSAFSGVPVPASPPGERAGSGASKKAI